LAGAVEALKDLETSFSFVVLGMDSDNGWEFLSHHVMEVEQEVTVQKENP